MKKLLLGILFLLFTVVPSWGVVTIDCTFDSAPSSEDNGGVYTCSTGTGTFYFSNLSGDVFDHVTGSECYGGTGGCAKFYRHITAQSYSNSYRQMDWSAYPTGNQLNVRWLMKVEDPNELGGKWLLTGQDYTWDTYLGMGRGGAPFDEYDITMCYDWTVCMWHGAGEDASSHGYEICDMPGTWGSSVQNCTETVTAQRFDFADYPGQWIAVEQEKNVSTGVMKVYIWTQNGDWDGLVFTLDTNKSSGIRVAPIPGYMEGADSNNEWIMIDNVIVSDSYIGPPAGFVTTTTTGSAVSVGVPIKIDNNLLLIGD